MIPRVKWLFAAGLICFLTTLFMSLMTTKLSVGVFVAQDFKLFSALRRQLDGTSSSDSRGHWIEWSNQGHKWFSQRYRFGKHKSKENHGNERFQPINTRNAWVYSAYFDPANQTIHTIKVFAIAKYFDNHTVQCHLEENGSTTVVNGVRKRMPDGHNSGFWAVCFMCSFSNKLHPKYVSLTLNVTDKPTNRLAVSYPQPREWLRDFTVCFAALHHYHYPSRLVHAIEINRVLGAEHFYVYNYTVSNTTDAVMRHYQDLGLLTVLQWPLPTLDVWYYAQNLAINDCVYRNRFVSQFVVIHDTDEYIVPARHGSWGELINATESDRKTTSAADWKNFYASYSFESTLNNGSPDKTQWDELKKNFSISKEEEQFITNHSLIPFLSLKRVNWTYKFNVRSKTIVRPEHIVYSGIHYTHNHRGNASYVVVNNDLAIVQHFYKNRRDTVLLDTSLLRFVHSVVSRLKSVLETLHVDISS